MKNIFVSIVILNWNSIDDAEKCIASVKNSTYKNYEIVVLDNGSKDGSADRLSKIDGIKLVSQQENLGFAGGHVEALKHCDGDAIILLNNDLVVDREYLQKIIDSHNDSGADIIGAKQYLWDGKATKKAGAFTSYQIINPNAGHATMLQVGDQRREVNSVSGAALFVTKKAIAKVGYLDPSFFAYYEETDLIARAKRAGLKVIYEPTACVWHKVAGSSGAQSFFYYYQMQRNRFRFAYKNFDRRYCRKLKAYCRREFLEAVARLITRRGDNRTFYQATAKAWLSNIWVRPSLFVKRQHIKKLGKFYTNKILAKTEGFDDVTVFVPNYNYAEHITKTLESISRQTVKPYEVIIVDDGSTDNSVKVIEKYLSSHRDDGVKYTFIKQKNHGVVYTKNLALKLVKTNHVIFLDSDDVLAPTYVEKTVRKMREDNADVVYTKMESSIAKTKFDMMKFNKIQLRLGNYIHNSALINMEMFRRVGGYKSAMKDGYEDWELMLSISEISQKFSFIPEFLLIYGDFNHGSRNKTVDGEKLREKVMKLHPALYSRKFFAYHYITSAFLYARLILVCGYKFIRVCLGLKNKRPFM